jgi:predicted RNA-binding Zn-ribbon protein involved in translation (DUF1610 family)
MTKATMRRYEKCPDCGLETPFDAEVCPHCGRGLNVKKEATYPRRRKTEP